MVKRTVKKVNHGGDIWSDIEDGLGDVVNTVAPIAEHVAPLIMGMGVHIKRLHKRLTALEEHHKHCHKGGSDCHLIQGGSAGVKRQQARVTDRDIQMTNPHFNEIDYENATANRYIKEHRGGSYPIGGYVVGGSDDELEMERPKLGAGRRCKKGSASPFASLLSSLQS